MVPQRHTRDTRSPGPFAGSVEDGGSGRAQLRAYDRIVLGMDPGTVLGSASAPLAPPRPAPRASGLFGLLWC
ncbi:hypothetical protein [Streptacidiphilus carbonis]|uniref:hypothetical protein n=1 Tax=Streptacidiphilus carbonis TaxID=105422 RepID=UPI0005A6E33A|nr:hypothetical protein [Streptacidiphilus carbonis]